jgi:hypothetical protein
VRVYAERVYGIPPEQVVGTAGGRLIGKPREWFERLRVIFDPPVEATRCDLHKSRWDPRARSRSRHIHRRWRVMKRLISSSSGTQYARRSGLIDFIAASHPSP